MSLFTDLLVKRDTASEFSAFRLLQHRSVKRATLGVAALLFLNPAVRAYSVLTHEAIIDTAWDSHIKPLLLARFPECGACAP